VQYLLIVVLISDYQLDLNHRKINAFCRVLSCAHHADATNDKPKDQVTTPDENSKTEADVTEHLRFLGSVKSAGQVARGHFAVYLSGEDDTDDSERKTAKN
jgi:hypothetical protein